MAYPEDSISADLMRSARIAIEKVIAVRDGEEVLIITNPQRDVFEISRALYNAVAGVGGRPVMMVQETKSQVDMAEDSIIAAIASNPDVVISISEKKLGKDRKGLSEGYVGEESTYDHIFTYLLGEKRIRSFWSPSITRDIFIRTVPVDYDLMARRGAKIKDILDRAVEVHITSPSGTDVVIGTGERKAIVDDGNFTTPGRGGNLPAGEVFISPSLGDSKGTIAYDGSIATTQGEIIIKDPIICRVEDGYIRAIEGGDEADILREDIESAGKTVEEMAAEGKIDDELKEEYMRNLYNLGELGIGLNPNARIIGNMLEDEKVYGTCHIAIGANYDNDARTIIHLDGLIKSPSIVAIMPDGEEIEVMRNGELSNSLL